MGLGLRDKRVGHYGGHLCVALMDTCSSRRVELWDDNLVMQSALAALAAVLAFGDGLTDLELPNEADSQWLSQGGRDSAAAQLLPRKLISSVSSRRWLWLTGAARKEKDQRGEQRRTAGERAGERTRGRLWRVERQSSQPRHEASSVEQRVARQRAVSTSVAEGGGRQSRFRAMSDRRGGRARRTMIPCV